MCIFATFLQAVNAPDYVTMHDEYRECMAAGSVRFTVMYITVGQITVYEKEVRVSKQNDDRQNYNRLKGLS